MSSVPQGSPTGRDRPPSEAYRPKRVRRRRATFGRRFKMLAGLACAGALGALVAELLHWQAQRRLEAMAGYVTDAAVMEHEYSAAHGRLLNDLEVRQLFLRAADLARNGDFHPAAGLLETVSKTAAVPAVFNDLGVAYAKAGDHARSVNAFREALARDANYPPALRNLSRLPGMSEREGRPVTREIEPNSSNATANVIAIGTQVRAEISAFTDDVDIFKFPSLGAPRDLVLLEIATAAPDLILGWNLFDAAGNQVAHGNDLSKPGAPVRYSFGPLPNTTYFLSVWGKDGTAGPYVVGLRALKAYDSYEPNDDIFHAQPIPLGQTIQANLMDGQDQDFYSFVAERNGTVDIALENLSPALVPALTAFGPDRRTVGFAPDAKGPGAGLAYSIAVEAGQTYFIQVWAVLDHTSGDYTLRLELR